MALDQLGVVIAGSKVVEGSQGQLMKSGDEDIDYNDVMIKKYRQELPSMVMGRNGCVSKGVKENRRDWEDVGSSGVGTRRVRHRPNADLGSDSCANSGMDGTLRDLCAAKQNADLYNTGRVTLPAGGGVFSDELLSSDFPKGVGASSNLRNTCYSNLALPSDFRKYMDFVSSYVDKKSSVVKRPTSAEGVATSLKNEHETYCPSASHFNDGTAMPYVYSPTSGSRVVLPKMKRIRISPAVIPKGEMVSAASTAGSKSGKIISPSNAYCSGVPCDCNGGSLNVPHPRARTPSPKMETDSTVAVPTTKASEQQPSVEQGRLHIPFAPKGRGLTVPFLPSSYGGGTTVKPKQKDTKIYSFDRRSSNGQPLTGDEEILHYQQNLINAGILSSLLKHNAFPSSGNTATTTLPCTNIAGSSSYIRDVHNEKSSSSPTWGAGSIEEFMHSSWSIGQKIVPKKDNPISPAAPVKKRGRGRPRKSKPMDQQQLGKTKLHHEKNFQLPQPSCAPKSLKNGSTHEHTPLSSSTEKKNSTDLKKVRLEEAYLLLSVSQDINKPTQSIEQHSPPPPLQKKNYGDVNAAPTVFS
eukprot:427863_1